MKKMLVTTALAATLLFGSMSANAACPCQQKGVMPKPMMEHMKKEWTPEQKAKMEQRKAEMDKKLGVTEEQKAKLKAIHEKAKAQIQPKIKKLAEVDYELDVIARKQFNSDKFGVKTLENVKLSGKTQEQLKNEAKTLRNEIRNIRKTCFEESQAVFTDEQKAILKQMGEEHAKKMKKLDRKHKKHFPKNAPIKK